LQKALKEVDPLTAKIRRKLFKKMAKDGAILRTKGEKKPTGLGAAELDIEKYEGENPSRYRILQQALFRKEWKVIVLVYLNALAVQVLTPLIRQTITCVLCVRACVRVCRFDACLEQFLA
jgi:hypothetical protein